ncbi:unnamed protein product [Spirodela intermedia]|uniref:endo-polygalacturonase n=1 Tax=Spirodela intermedia TaxID=51605 RepID=A0A7I8ILJ8_SPIIN|nr:unnamed protein product [Spirodela intermedia]CAA6658042.1 unnamed protein product [Spirodela intermedia]
MKTTPSRHAASVSPAPPPRRRRRAGGGWRTVYSVDRFGAIGDGLHNDTEAFLQAWQAVCSSPTQAVLKVPARKTYLVWPLDFSGHCSSNSTLVLWRDLNPHKWLYFVGLNDLSLRGGGTIDGKGERWWGRSCKINKNNPCRRAPTAINFHRCKNLRVQNLTLLNSQKMHIALTNCTGVKVSGLRVIAPADSPNTDGIHISSSVHVEIKNSEIKTGDDCISIVSESSMVKIRDLSCGPGHGISIGSLGKHGSWSNVSSIQVNRVTFTNTTNGFRIKTWQGGRGFAHKIYFQNATMENVSNPIIINQYYCDSSRPCLNKTSAVKVHQVSFKNIRGTSATRNAIKFACSDKVPCEKILLKNIQLSLLSGDRPSSYRWKAHVSCYGSVDPPVCVRRWGDFDPLKLRSSEAHWFISDWIGYVLNFRIGDFLLKAPFLHRNSMFY